MLFPIIFIARRPALIHDGCDQGLNVRQQVAVQRCLEQQQTGFQLSDGFYAQQGHIDVFVRQRILDGQFRQ